MALSPTARRTLPTMSIWLRGRVEIVQGDITQLHVTAIVNAAAPSLLGGGGVDGAIHDAAGPGLLEECRGLGGARHGEAKITAGHRLRARHVVHAVGPVWQGGGHGEDGLLTRCYEEAIRLAARHGAESVAFPAISTGAYRFPLERATRIAQASVRAALAAHPRVGRVVLCCFSARAREVYEAVAADELNDRSCPHADVRVIHDHPHGAVETSIAELRATDPARTREWLTVGAACCGSCAMPISPAELRPRFDPGGDLEDARLRI
jgi:O-acetyl-ADP-ribose deacetylase